MSGPHCFHLLVADDAVTEFHQYRTYVALCGELLGASELPSGSCSEDCDAGIVYCLECLGTATERNHDARGRVDCPAGIGCASQSVGRP